MHVSHDRLRPGLRARRRAADGLREAHAEYDVFDWDRGRLELGGHDGQEPRPDDAVEEDGVPARRECRGRASRRGDHGRVLLAGFRKDRRDRVRRKRAGEPVTMVIPVINHAPRQIARVMKTLNGSSVYPSKGPQRTNPQLS